MEASRNDIGSLKQKNNSTHQCVLIWSLVFFSKENTHIVVSSLKKFFEVGVCGN